VPDTGGSNNVGFLVHRSQYGAKIIQRSNTLRDAAVKLVREIKRRTRKQYSAEEKSRIVLAGLRSKEGIAENLNFSC
jgi:hypothetical protein